jgi:hypothetical protein
MRDKTTQEDNSQTDASQNRVAIDSEMSSSPSGFDDCLSPGGQHFTFGTFKELEIKNICRMQISESNSVAFNEYGTNLIKHKYDPLAVIEAKFAMAIGNSKISELMASDTRRLETIEEKNEELEKSPITQIQFPSPGAGTQEAPGAELSSQEEELALKNTHEVQN